MTGDRRRQRAAGAVDRAVGGGDPWSDQQGVTVATHEHIDDLLGRAPVATLDQRRRQAALLELTPDRDRIP